MGTAHDNFAIESDHVLQRRPRWSYWFLMILALLSAAIFHISAGIIFRRPDPPLRFTDNARNAPNDPMLAYRHSYANGLPFVTNPPFHMRHSQHKDGERVWCHFDNPSDTTGYRDSYTYNLTLLSAEFFFFNESPDVSGQVQFDAVSGSAPAMAGSMGETRARFSVASHVDGCSANICLLREEEEGNTELTVVVYPRSTGGELPCGANNLYPYPVDIQASITFVNPMASAKALNISRVKMNANNMGVRINDFQGHAEIHRLDVETVDGDIIVDNLHAHLAKFVTKFGNITATVSAWLASFIIWGGAGQSMKVNMTVLNDNEEDMSVVQLHQNGPGRMDVDVVLAGAPQVELQKAPYIVWAQHIDSSARINITSMPVGADLEVYHRTFGVVDAALSLPLTFEGPFTLYSRDATPPGVEVRNASDPAGRGRNRTVLMEYEGCVLAGEVYWGARPRWFGGSVYSESSATPVKLIL